MSDPRDELAGLLAEGGGVLRLGPGFVARSSFRPGRRLGPPDEGLSSIAGRPRIQGEACYFPPGVDPGPRPETFFRPTSMDRAAVPTTSCCRTSPTGTVT